mmetsp:Transcript_29691/g.58313  ORF Transcript_29691/g.58313 Transcript_29691/m.58313 type:complete len:124 (+) Transcript_29691:50-421(+)
MGNMATVACQCKEDVKHAQPRNSTSFGQIFNQMRLLQGHLHQDCVSAAAMPLSQPHVNHQGFNVLRGRENVHAVGCRWRGLRQQPPQNGGLGFVSGCSDTLPHHVKPQQHRRLVAASTSQLQT